MSTSFRSVMSERAELVCGRMGENLVTTLLLLLVVVVLLLLLSC